MKPWTWNELTDKAADSDECDAFVKTYGEIGAVALELANRLSVPGEITESAIENIKTCGCAMCKQWHEGCSDEQVRQLYEKLYNEKYGK